MQTMAGKISKENVPNFLPPAYNIISLACTTSFHPFKVCYHFMFGKTVISVFTIPFRVLRRNGLCYEKQSVYQTDRSIFSEPFKQTGISQMGRIPKRFVG